MRSKSTLWRHQGTFSSGWRPSAKELPELKLSSTWCRSRATTTPTMTGTTPARCRRRRRRRCTTRKRRTLRPRRRRARVRRLRRSRRHRRKNPWTGFRIKSLTPARKNKLLNSNEIGILHYYSTPNLISALHWARWWPDPGLGKNATGTLTSTRSHLIQAPASSHKVSFFLRSANLSRANQSAFATYFLLHFSQSAFLIPGISSDGTARIFFLPPYAAARIRTRVSRDAPTQHDLAMAWFRHLLDWRMFDFLSIIM